LPKGPGKRLSPEEVAAILRRARQYFDASDFIVGSPLHTSADFQELSLFSHEEQKDALQEVLREVSPEFYCGPHPPDHLAGEPKCKGERLIQFSWQSECFNGKQMYVKFCLKHNRLILLRIHVDYYERKK
jgi:hypothetical protein